MKKSRIIVILILLLIIFIFFCFKNKDNNKEYSKEEVIISKESMATKEDTLSITMETKKGYKIYYTLDGSIPDNNGSHRKLRTDIQSGGSSHCGICPGETGNHGNVHAGKSVQLLSAVYGQCLSHHGHVADA